MVEVVRDPLGRSAWCDTSEETDRLLASWARSGGFVKAVNKFDVVAGKWRIFVYEVRRHK